MKKIKFLLVAILILGVTTTFAASKNKTVTKETLDNHDNKEVKVKKPFYFIHLSCDYVTINAIRTLNSIELWIIQAIMEEELCGNGG